MPHNPGPCTQAQLLLEPNNTLQTGGEGRVLTAHGIPKNRASLMPGEYASKYWLWCINRETEAREVPLFSQG